MSTLAIIGIGIGAIILGVFLFVFLVVAPVSVSSQCSRQEEQHWLERGE